jgi:hypothetical protein
MFFAAHIPEGIRFNVQNSKPLLHGSIVMVTISLIATLTIDIIDTQTIQPSTFVASSSFGW